MDWQLKGRKEGLASDSTVQSTLVRDEKRSTIYGSTATEDGHGHLS